MRSAVTLTSPADLIAASGLVGAAGAALLGAGTALTATTNRTLLTISVPGLTLGYAIVFSNAISSALIVGYCIALSWWAVTLAAHTARLAFAGSGQTLRRLLNGDVKN